MPVRALGSFLLTDKYARHEQKGRCFNAREGSGVFSTQIRSERLSATGTPGFNAREGSGVFSTVRLNEIKFGRGYDGFNAREGSGVFSTRLLS